MCIPQLGSPQFFEFIETQIFRVKYAFRREKAPKREEKSSLKKKTSMLLEKFTFTVSA